MNIKQHIFYGLCIPIHVQDASIQTTDFPISLVDCNYEASQKPKLTKTRYMYDLNKKVILLQSWRTFNYCLNILLPTIPGFRDDLLSPLLTSLGSKDNLIFFWPGLEPSSSNTEHWTRVPTVKNLASSGKLVVCKYKVWHRNIGVTFEPACASMWSSFKLTKWLNSRIMLVYLWNLYSYM